MYTIDHNFKTEIISIIYEEIILKKCLVIWNLEKNRTQCLHLNSFIFEKQTSLYFGALNNVNFEFMQILGIDQIEVWLLQSDVFPPPIEFRNLTTPCALISLFLITDHSGANHFFSNDFHFHFQPFEHVYLGIQMFLLLFKI